MKKLGIFSWFSYEIPVLERLCMIKSVGFDAVSLWGGEEDCLIINEQITKCREIGLEIDNIHAPFDRINDLWADEYNGEEFLDILINCARICGLHEIPTMVVHCTRSVELPEITGIGLERIRKLVEFCEKSNVNIAFENIKDFRHLEYIFSNIKSERLGFCFDSGHENYAHSAVDCLEKYGEKLLCVHLEDNFGDLDTHLLPFDGTIDWVRLAKRLGKCRDIKYLTLEVDFNREHEKSGIYRNLPALEYLKTAYDRAVKIRELLGE